MRIDIRVMFEAISVARAYGYVGKTLAAEVHWTLSRLSQYLAYVDGDKSKILFTFSREEDLKRVLKIEPLLYYRGALEFHREMCQSEVKSLTESLEHQIVTSIVTKDSKLASSAIGTPRVVHFRKLLPMLRQGLRVRPGERFGPKVIEGLQWFALQCSGEEPRLNLQGDLDRTMSKLIRECPSLYHSGLVGQAKDRERMGEASKAAIQHVEEKRLRELRNVFADLGIIQDVEGIILDTYDESGNASAGRRTKEIIEAKRRRQ